MSINFERDVSDSTIEKIRECFGDPVAWDRKQFLFNNMREIRQSEMREVAKTARQPATVEIHGDGEIKTMADGTRYEVTPNGWRRLPE